MTTHKDAGELLKLAEIIHAARWPADRQMAVTPFADEDSNGREYCLRIARAVLAAPVLPSAVQSGEPLGWLHEITEPMRGYTKMYSSSADNPWSHWLESYKADCSYKATPLYAGAAQAAADATRMRRAILGYLSVWDACGGSESVSLERFADARHALREAVAEVPASPLPSAQSEGSK